jgi:hypothetical protein
MTNQPQKAGSEELQSEWTDDAIIEPPNSTVDDWIGQRTERDVARAEEALEQTGGDESEAEELFDQQTERRAGEPAASDE